MYQSQDRARTSRIIKINTTSLTLRQSLTDKPARGEKALQAAVMTVGCAGDRLMQTDLGTLFKKKLRREGSPPACHRRDEKKLPSLPNLRAGALELREKTLPFLSVRQQVIDAIRDRASRAIVVLGPTGCGKTTGMIETFMSLGERVVIILPRRAMCDAHHQFYSNERKHLVAEAALRAGISVDKYLGINHGGRKEFCEESRILFVTPAIYLLKGGFPGFTVFFDEAHLIDDSVESALVFAQLKATSPVTPNFKVIFSSATLDPGPIVEAFQGATVIVINGRQYPIEVLPPPTPAGYAAFVDNHCDQVAKLMPPDGGTVLTFAPRIRDTIALAEELSVEHPDTKAFAFHAAIAQEDREAALRAYPGQKVSVIATSVADSSITIPGTVAVIDSGLTIRESYDEDLVRCLTFERLTKSEAEQRAGRAGRTQPGVVIRYYKPEGEYPPPATETADFSSLRLLLGRERLLDLNSRCLRPIPRIRLDATDRHLRVCGMLGRRGHNTPKGQFFVDRKLPLAPHLGKVLWKAAESGNSNFLELAIDVVAAAEGDTIFVAKGHDVQRLLGGNPNSEVLAHGLLLGLVTRDGQECLGGVQVSSCRLSKALSLRERLRGMFGFHPQGPTQISPNNSQLGPVRELVAVGWSQWSFILQGGREDGRPVYRSIGGLGELWTPSSHSMDFSNPPEYLVGSPLRIITLEGRAVHLLTQASVVDRDWLDRESPQVYRKQLRAAHKARRKSLAYQKRDKAGDFQSQRQREARRRR